MEVLRNLGRVTFHAIREISLPYQASLLNMNPIGVSNKVRSNVTLSSDTTVNIFGE
jgi:hypothetical protein